jgi:F0F1-type ATP synthase delta subunit
MFKLPFFQSKKEQTQEEKFLDKLREYGISQEEYEALLSSKGISASDYVDFQAINTLLNDIKAKVESMEIIGRNLSTFSQAPRTPDTTISNQERSLQNSIKNARTEGLAMFDKGIVNLKNQIERVSDNFLSEDYSEEIKRDLLHATASFRENLLAEIKAVEELMTPIGIRIGTIVHNRYQNQAPLSRNIWNTVWGTVIILSSLFVFEISLNFSALQNVGSFTGTENITVVTLIGAVLALCAHFLGFGLAKKDNLWIYSSGLIGLLIFIFVAYFRFIAQINNINIENNEIGNNIMMFILSIVIYFIGVGASFLRQPNAEYWNLKSKYDELRSQFDRLQQIKQLYESDMIFWIQTITEQRTNNTQDFLNRKEDILSNIERRRESFIKKMETFWQNGSDTFRAGVREQESFFKRDADAYWSSAPPSLDNYTFSENKANFKTRPNNHRRNFKGRNPIGFRRP